MRSTERSFPAPYIVIAAACLAVSVRAQAAAEDNEYVHAGPYARVTVGAGPITGEVNESHPFAHDPELDGTAWAVDAHLGTAPVPGFVVGVVLTHARVFAAEWSRDSGSAQGTLSTTQLGAFLDGFLVPEAGFHLGGAIGYATTYVEGSGPEPVSTAGYALSLWSGYDFWLEKDWSLGPLLRANLAATSAADRMVGTAILTLGISGLYQ